MIKHAPPDWLQAYAPICEAISRLLHPYAEVAVHDLASDRIVALWNPFSGRKVGDPALLSTLHEDIEQLHIYGPFGKVLPDGRNLTSVSSVLVDAKGAIRGLLCINFDRSAFDGISDLLTRFLAPTALRPPELFSRDWREQIALVVDEECRRHQLRRNELTRKSRLLLVEALNKQGLFSTRQAASHAAHVIGVSRATIYSMLKELNS